MVGYACTAVCTVHADMTLTQSKVKVMGPSPHDHSLIPFWDLLLLLQNCDNVLHCSVGLLIFFVVCFVLLYDDVFNDRLLICNFVVVGY